MNALDIIILGTPALSAFGPLFMMIGVMRIRKKRNPFDHMATIVIIAGFLMTTAAILSLKFNQ